MNHKMMSKLATITFCCLLSLSSFSLKQTRFKGKMNTVPQREVSIIVTDEGFYPNKFMAYAGERIDFFVTSTTERPSCFMVKNKELFMAAKKGKISEGSVFFTQPGLYHFYCPSMKNINGTITVIEHPDVIEKRKARDLASEKKVKVWIPEDE